MSEEKKEDLFRYKILYNILIGEKDLSIDLYYKNKLKEILKKELLEENNNE